MGVFEIGNGGDGKICEEERISETCGFPKITGGGNGASGITGTSPITVSVVSVSPFSFFTSFTSKLERRQEFTHVLKKFPDANHRCWIPSQKPEPVFFCLGRWGTWQKLHGTSSFQQS
ncbi:MAG: hypothetical protein Q4D98_04540 [Planctomycetia bacterium]|nr:hypothetical protein [Planctomycetia bacterium]